MCLIDNILIKTGVYFAYRRRVWRNEVIGIHKDAAGNKSVGAVGQGAANNGHMGDTQAKSG